MGELKDLAPSLELCKLIPAEEFANSALVWRVVRNTVTGERLWDDVFPRECGRCGDCEECEYPAVGRVIASAPTLQEILSALPACNCYRLDKEWTVWFGDESALANYKSSNPTIAALRMWLEQKGIEYEK